MLKVRSLRLRQMIRAILARPELCGPEHDTAVYELARTAAHTALTLNRDLCPGWRQRY